MASMGSRLSAAEAPRSRASRLSALQTPDKQALHAQAFKGLRSLILSTAFNATMAKGGNPLWPGIGYEGPDLERAQKPTQARLQAEAVLQQGMLHVGDAPCKKPEDFLDFIRSGFGKAFCAEASNPTSPAGSRPAQWPRMTACSSRRHAACCHSTLQKANWALVEATMEALVLLFRYCHLPLDAGEACFCSLLRWNYRLPGGHQQAACMLPA